MKTLMALASGAMLVALLGCTRTAPPRTVTPPPDYQASVRPLVERYCTSCHSPGGDAGDEHDFTRLEVLRSQHRLVTARLRAQSMPPSTSPQPSESERALLLQWAGGM